MKRITIIGILTFLLTGNLIGQIEQKDIYEVMNEIIKIQNVESLTKFSNSIEIPNPIQHEFIDWCINQAEDKIDKSQVDSTFILEQTSRFNEIKWDKNRIEKELKIKKKKATHYFSIPLYLNNKKEIFIVYHSEYYGPLAASGTYEMYHKVNGDWKLMTVMLVWIA